MPLYLKQSTASQEIPLGYFLDSTDGNSEETGLTIANTDILLWKSGGTTLPTKNSGGAIHISNGIYYAVLDATDTNTLGSLIVFCHPAGALAVRVECVVLAANVYDSLIGATDALQVDTVQIEGADASDTINAQVDIALADYDAPTSAELVTEINSVQSDIAALSIPSAASIASAVWSAATRLLTAGTNIVLAKGTGVTGFNDLSAAQVNAEVVDALATDTYAEPGQGAPLATASVVAKINYLYKAWRNKSTQTATTYSLLADDALTVDQKATVSDDGTTFARNEIASGP